MLFSFVLPAYKAKYLSSAIESILSQTYKEFELIIVNDASPENLDSIVNSYQDTRICYYKNQENIGRKDLVKQWNHCINYAKGEYIILASDDDVYTSNFLSTFIPLIKKYTQVNVFRARSLDIDGKDKICGTDDYYNEYLNPNEFKYLWFSGKIKWSIANYIFNRRVLINNGGFINFPLGWGSDSATILLMANNGLVSSNDYLFMFRYSGINISSKNDGKFLKKKLQARMKECQWREEHQNIQINNSLDQFYQDTIILRQKGYVYNSIYHILDQMNFPTFLSSIKDILSYNLIKKNKRYSIIFMILGKFIKQPFIYLKGCINYTIKRICELIKS